MRASDARVRLVYVLTTGLLVATGLTVYLQGDVLDPRARDWLGDALWAAMIASLVSIAAPRQRVLMRCAAALLICYAVEFSQLVHAPALDRFRGTRIGHLMLGSDFDARDLFAYAIGVLAFGAADYAMARLVARRAGRS